MSGGYYNNQQQGYGAHNYQQSSEAPQYMHQNYAYNNNNQGFVPSHRNNPAFVAVTEEYLRQPAASPYPSAPSMPMPEPVPPVVCMTEPSPAPAPMQEPTVIIVQQPPARDDGCCRGCCKWRLSRTSCVILTLILIVVSIRVGISLVYK